jgi:hypothetical protein
MEEWKSKIITLAHPITVGERSVTSLTCYELDADGLEAIEDCQFVAGQDAKVGQIKRAIAAVTRTDVSIIGKLHQDDFAKMGEEIIPFIDGSLRSSPPKTSTSEPDSAGSVSIPSAPTSPTG